MRAAFCPGPGAFEIRSVPDPVPAPGEAVIRVRGCGVCGSDLHWFRGELPPPAVCPGHEIAGEVIALNGSDGTLEIGARVAVEPLLICGRCRACRSGNYQLCQILELVGIARPGGFAEYLTMPVGRLYRLPEAMDYGFAALAEPAAVCVHAVRLGNVGLGDRVLVLGAGTVGLLSALAARAAGASEVVVSARHEHQAAAARRVGATRVFAATPAGDEERSAFLDEHPADVVIETVGGQAQTLEDALLAVRRGGTVVVLGVFSSVPRCSPLLLVVKEIRLVGSVVYGSAGPRADFERALDLLANAPEASRSLVTARVPLDQMEEGFRLAADKSRGTIKVEVIP